tara:strand:- start:5765 stop:6475 length:711 start_codon:yes stop_codon:yes gene_type:complete
MINGNKILAIVPARSGSKGVKNKNKKIIAKKPLIFWTLKNALASKYIDYVLVTTDSEDIRKIVRKERVEVPFLRPANLSSDDASMDDVIHHALAWTRANDKFKSDQFILLQPTSPFRNNKHIDEALELANCNKKFNSVVSISKVTKHPFWMKKIDDNGRLKDFMSKKSLKYSNRQSLPILYQLNGAIYIAENDYFFKNKVLFDENSKPYIMDEYSSLDIDSIFDWDVAQFLSKTML